MRKGLFFTVLFVVVCGIVAAARNAQARSTDVVIDTNDSGPISLNDKVNADNERVVFYQEGNTAVSINEDGDPNVGMKF